MLGLELLCSEHSTPFFRMWLLKFRNIFSLKSLHSIFSSKMHPGYSFSCAPFELGIQCSKGIIFGFNSSSLHFSSAILWLSFIVIVLCDDVLKAKVVQMLMDDIPYIFSLWIVRTKKRGENYRNAIKNNGAMCVWVFKNQNSCINQLKLARMLKVCSLGDYSLGKNPCERSKSAFWDFGIAQSLCGCNTCKHAKSGLW